MIIFLNGRGNVSMKDKFEWLCRQNSVVAEYLDKCHFSEVDGQYVLTVHDYDMLFMEDRLNGAYWAFCEQEKAVNILKADLEHYKRDGFAVVPVDPTPDMIQSLIDEVKKSGHLVDFYKAMIAPYVK